MHKPRHLHSVYFVEVVHPKIGPTSTEPAETIFVGEEGISSGFRVLVVTPGDATTGDEDLATGEGLVVG